MFGSRRYPPFKLRGGGVQRICSSDFLYYQAAMGKVGLRLALLCVAGGLRLWAGVEGELVLLVTLTRHGSRVSELNSNMILDPLP